jgi:hypothetical protein
MSTIDLIDHFELCVNDVLQKKPIAVTDVQFSAAGFSGGEPYQVNIVAYPKTNIIDAEPLVSNTKVKILDFLINRNIFFHQIGI